MTAIKDAYTAQELSKLLGVTVKSVLVRASRESWQSRPRSGRGGGSEWLVASMPQETRLALQSAVQRQELEAAHAERARADGALMPEVLRRGHLPALRDVTPVSATPSATPVSADCPQDAVRTTPLASLAILDDRRRYRALAKSDLVRLYLEWQRKHGATVHQKTTFMHAYLGGAWPKLLTELGERVSWKSLERWKNEQSKAGNVLVLADKRGLAHRGRTLVTAEHEKVILGQLLNPNAPKIGQCVRRIQARCTELGIDVPSEATIRRWAKVYMQECFNEWVLWREGKKAWNDKCALSILRDWSLVGVGDIVIADGHTLNFETINPETGKAKRMTLLLYFDGASNHPLGWEVMPTENTACIASAFRRTCLALGKFPRVVYIDNGKAFRAKFFKGCTDFAEAGFLGLYKDLDCEVIHAWPYHGQSKPVERFFGTMLDMEIFVPSYTGNCIDAKPARMKRGEPLHNRLYEALGGRPLTLEATHEVIARWFVDYVNRPQVSTHLRGRTPAEVFHEGRGPGLSEAEQEKLVLFMLQKTVSTITKDGIKLHGRLYWHEALSSRRHEVLVRYDTQLTQTVLVYTLEGRFVCEALDRAHFRIAAGMHPAARVLGTQAQQQALSEAIALKRGLEKTAGADIKTMLEEVVLPETRRNVIDLRARAEKRAEEATPARMRKPLPVVDVQAIEEAKARARAEIQAQADAPAYTPAAHMRFPDAPAKYEYLFKAKYEQGHELVAEDAAWMAWFESTPDFIRNMKRRYDSILQLYSFKAQQQAC